MLTCSESPNIANCLLSNGAEIETESDEGSTALEQACCNGHTAVVKVLLKRGALGQMLKSNRRGHTPLSVAASFAHEEITLLLLQHLVLQPAFDINHPRLAISQPLLCCAAIWRLYRVAEFALDHGADANITRPDGPPLIIAVDRGHASMVSLLCKKGANVQTRYGSMNSLDKAVVDCNAQLVKLLIKYGADVNVRAVHDSRHPFALLQTFVLGDCSIVQQLLDAGAALDIEQQLIVVRECCDFLEDTKAVKVLKLLLPHCSSFADSNYELGSRMLVEAVYRGKLQVAQLLLAAGADVHSTDDGGTLMHYAAASGSIAVVKWLQSLGLDPRAVSGDNQILPLHDACEHEQLQMAKYLLALPGAVDDILVINVNWQTPLHLAAESGADSVVQLLLHSGADADVGDVDGSTPLMLAGSVAVVKLLLAAGAAAAAVDNDSASVLHYHAMNGATAGAICLLLKAGADPTTVNSDGSTPAHVAGMRGHFTLEVLLSRAADDYRKKHPTDNSIVHSSDSTEQSGSISSSVSSDTSSSVDGSDPKHSDSVQSATTDISDSSVTACAGRSASRTDHRATVAAIVDATDDRHCAPSSTTSNTNSETTQKANDVCQNEQQQQQQRKARRVKQPCANCSKPTTKLCRRCAAVYYCSVECQKVCFADTQHRAQCEATAAQTA
jgi:ankyrin repeat protein